MRRHAGFTLIELLITVTVMVILLTLAVVSLRSSQANARDEKRKTDATTIARYLEDYYRSGSTGASYTPGEYPPTIYLNSESNITAALRDVNPDVLRAPDVPKTDPVSLSVATSISAQSPSTSQYIYQPIDRNGALCDAATDFCSKFILYYKLETDGTVQKITSKHQ